MRYLPSMKIKHHRQFDEPIHGLKKKIISKPKTKNLTKIKYVFLGNPLCELPSSKKTI